ncbi:Rpn family recombination-promoting nuclease/putative transposase [Chamaesiphon sp. OTE_8_metabat_110]|uniref:Rpn family recombination-promoting nuclease/putative transposase n=1 Tax=Chamaesiphon sp. OTE_8_metabat_110 TaxID=2964696 RepID=UPI00286B47F7|nr:Rpn family recombination-promoting nuclease/putative transposase [Chamaesiphon sp. OTE_8_metabat_110]
MRRDTIFYQLFQQSPTLLFELLPQPPARANEYVFEAVEVKETAFRMDGVFVPPDRSGIVYFCEAQFQKDEMLYERMVSEIGIYVYRNRERLSDWQAVAIYPSRSIEQSNTGMVRELLASGRILRVFLDELGEIEELPSGVGLMVLTTLEGNAAKTEARRAIARSGGDRDIIEMITKIVVYKFNSLSRDEVDVMLGIELQQTRVYQEAKAEGKVEGKAEEREIGLQRERALILRQLNRKLGNLSSQLQSKVSALSIENVESLGEALLDFNSSADLEAWLSQN